MIRVPLNSFGDGPGYLEVFGTGEIGLYSNC